MDPRQTYRLALAFALWSAVAHGQDPGELRDLRERIEKLERQNRGFQEQEAKRKEEEEKKKKETDEKAKQDEEKKKADEAKKKAEEEAGHVVGSDSALRALWDNGLFFESAQKDWRIHVGGRFNFDNVWWRQPALLKGPPPGNGGIPNSRPGDGVGSLDDGFFFRRVRFRADGTVYENIEFVTEFAFENLNQIAYDHLWAGVRNLPLLGTVRVGQIKVPQGIEMIASDYHIPLLERSALADAFWNLFAPGVLFANTYCDQNVTTQTMFHRIQPIQPFDGADFGDGDYAITTRVTGTPVYEYDGRCLLHLGASYQWRHGDLGRTAGGTGNDFADTQSVVRFRNRASLRDGIGNRGTSARFVDTGWLLGRDVHTAGQEFLAAWGPFSVQAESTFAVVQDAASIYPAADFNRPRGDPVFWGGYVQLSYFLTGEQRIYDRRFGAQDRIRINEDCFLVRGDDGRCHYGIGAWELAYRYCYTDLNDNGITGGLFGEHTAGLNWYFHDSFKLQFNYLNIQRNVAGPANSGTVHGFGIRTQFYF